MGEGKVNRALDLLQRVAPPLEQDPEYHALMAALYQRQGQSMLSAKIYEQLLALHPNTAVWWIGLGIALESDGKNNAAKEAYLHASQGAGLNTALNAFIQTRMDNL